MRVLGVHVVQSSVKSSRSNAALAGAGRTRRIVLTDTLLKTHGPDEIETILAHELAHQKHRDPAVGFGTFILTSFVSLAVLQAVLPWAVGVLGLHGIADVAGLPGLMVAPGVLSPAVDPLARGPSPGGGARGGRPPPQVTGEPGGGAGAEGEVPHRDVS